MSCRHRHVIEPDQIRRRIYPGSQGFQQLCQKPFRIFSGTPSDAFEKPFRNLSEALQTPSRNISESFHNTPAMRLFGCLQIALGGVDVDKKCTTAKTNDIVNTYVLLTECCLFQFLDLCECLLEAFSGVLGASEAVWKQCSASWCDLWTYRIFSGSLFWA